MYFSHRGETCLRCFNSAVWRAIWPAVLGISTLYILRTMKVSGEGKEHAPERNQNLPSDTAITFQITLKLFHCVDNIQNQGLLPSPCRGDCVPSLW